MPFIDKVGLLLLLGTGSFMTSGTLLAATVAVLDVGSRVLTGNALVTFAPVLEGAAVALR